MTKHRESIKPSRELHISKVTLTNLLVVTILLLVAPLTLPTAQAELPGFKAPMPDTPALPSVFQNLVDTTSTGANQSAVADEIEELARGLRYNPGLLYKFCHDYIRWEPTWGDKKGAFMTWMDRSGIKASTRPRS